MSVIKSKFPVFVLPLMFLNEFKCERFSEQKFLIHTMIHNHCLLNDTVLLL